MDWELTTKKLKFCGGKSCGEPPNVKILLGLRQYTLEIRNRIERAHEWSLAVMFHVGKISFVGQHAIALEEITRKGRYLGANVLTTKMEVA